MFLGTSTERDYVLFRLVLPVCICRHCFYNCFWSDGWKNWIHYIHGLLRLSNWVRLSNCFSLGLVWDWMASNGSR